MSLIAKLLRKIANRHDQRRHGRSNRKPENWVKDLADKGARDGLRKTADRLEGDDE